MQSPFLPKHFIVFCRDGEILNEADDFENDAQEFENQTNRKPSQLVQSHRKEDRRKSHSHSESKSRKERDCRSQDSNKSHDSKRSCDHRKKDRQKSHSHSRSKSRNERDCRSHDRNKSHDRKRSGDHRKSGDQSTSQDNKHILGTFIEHLQKDFDHNNNLSEIPKVHVSRPRTRQTKKVAANVKRDIEKCTDCEDHNKNNTDKASDHMIERWSSDENIFRQSQTALANNMSPLNIKQPLSPIVIGPNDSELLKYAQEIYVDILEFLGSHQLSLTEVPYVTVKYGPNQLKTEHPKIYKKIMKRLKVPQNELDDLLFYLCQRFPQFLGGTRNVTGLVQRLEEVGDFVLKKYQNCRKTKNRNRKNKPQAK